MTEQKINYIISAILVLAVLVAGYFGITLPVQPEIPDPLPVDLAPVEESVAALGERLDDLEAQEAEVVSYSTYGVPCYKAQSNTPWVAVSDPLTITGVLTDVRVLYYQVP